jgi:hypothetical protein
LGLSAGCIIFGGTAWYLLNTKIAEANGIPDAPQEEISVPVPVVGRGFKLTETVVLPVDDLYAHLFSGKFPTVKARQEEADNICQASLEVAIRNGLIGKTQEEIDFFQTNFRNGWGYVDGKQRIPNIEPDESITYVCISYCVINTKVVRPEKFPTSYKKLSIYSQIYGNNP